MQSNLARHVKWFVPIFLLIGAEAFAANYTFPGALPAGCSGSGPSYTCGTLSLIWGDTITINSPKPATITVNGNLTTDGNNINTAGATADLTLIVNGALATGYGTRIVGDITTQGASGNVSIDGCSACTPVTGSVTASGSVSLTSSTSRITGNVTAGGGVTLAWGGRIDGTTTATSVSDSGGCTYGGNVTATTGAVSLGYGSNVTGNVVARATSGGTVTVGGSTTRPQVSGCVLTNSTAAGSINFNNWNSSAGGVCCKSGSSCLAVSNACYSNSSNPDYPLSTAACAALTAPNQVKVGACTVAGVTDTFTTIQAAVNGVATNGTVWICPGTYAENVSIAGKALTLKSSTGNKADVTISPTATAAIASNAALTVQNLSIASANAGVNGINACPASPATLTLSGVDINVANSQYGDNYGIFQNTSGSGCQGLTLNLANVTANSPRRGYGIRLNNGAGAHVLNTVSATGGDHGYDNYGGIRIVGGASFTATNLDVTYNGSYPSRGNNAALWLQNIAGNISVTANDGRAHAIRTTGGGNYAIYACPNADSTFTLSGAGPSALTMVSSTLGAAIYQNTSGNCTGKLTLNLANLDVLSTTSSGIYLNNGGGAHALNYLSVSGRSEDGGLYPLAVLGGTGATLTDVDVTGTGTSRGPVLALLQGMTGAVTLNTAQKSRTAIAKTTSGAGGIQVLAAAGSTIPVTISNVNIDVTECAICTGSGGGWGKHTFTGTNITTGTRGRSGIGIYNGAGNHSINNATLYGVNGAGWPLRIDGGADITLADVDAYQLGTSASGYPAVSLNAFTGNLTVSAPVKSGLGNRCPGNFNTSGAATATYPGACIMNLDAAAGTVSTNRAASGFSIANAVGSTSQVNISGIYAQGASSGINTYGGGSYGKYTANLSNVTAEVTAANFGTGTANPDTLNNHGWAYPISISSGTGTHMLTNVTAIGTYARMGISISGGGATLTDVYATGLGSAVSLGGMTGPVTVSNPAWAAANPYPATNPATFPIRGVSWPNGINGAGLEVSLGTASATTVTLQNTAIGGAGSGMLLNYNSYSYPNLKLVMSNITVDAAKGSGVTLYYGTGQAHALSNVTVKATGTALSLSRGTNAALSNLDLTCGNDGATAGNGLYLGYQTNLTLSGINPITCKSPNSIGIFYDYANSGSTLGGAIIDMQSQAGSIGISESSSSSTGTITGNTIKNAPSYGIYINGYPTPANVISNIVENSGGTNYGINMARGGGIAYNNCVYSPASHVISSASSLCAGISPCNTAYPLVDPKPSATATKQGNFWGSWPKGTGYSDTCTDANSDGVCDSATGGDNAPLKRCGSAPLADWRMDESGWNGTTGEIKDASTSAYHGTATGTTTAEGKLCRAANLSATGTGDYLSFPHQALNGRDAFSVAFWFKTAKSKPQQELLQGLGGSASDDQIEIYLVNTTQVVVNIRDTGNTTFTAPDTLTNNVWHHLVFTRSGTSGCLYIDGTLVECKTTYPAGALAITANSLLSGQEQDSYGGGFNSGQAHEGYIDELKIWGRPLSAVQIAAGYANENAGKNWDGSARTCTSGPDHYEISLPSAGVACASVTATVTACASPGTTTPCTSKYAAASGKTATLATSAGTLSAVTVTFDSTGTASATLNYPDAADGATATVTLSGEQLPGTTLRQCCPDGANCVARDNCTVTFNTAGLIISDSATGGAVTPATQISGTSSGTYYLRAVKGNPAAASCQTAVSGSRSVNFSYGCVDPNAGCTDKLSINGGTAFGPAATAQTLSFNATTGAAPFTFRYDDAGKISLTAGPVTAANGATLAATTTGSFVVKPAALCVYSTDLSDCTAANASCPKAKKAGEAFNLTVTAVRSGYDCASPSTYVTPNYKTTAGISLDSETTAPAGGGGSVEVTRMDIAAGGSAAVNQSISEVGVFRFTATPPSYFGETIGSPPFKSGNLGRFYPDRFELTPAGTPVTPGCGSFTYFGQDGFATAFTLTAQNTSGGTTQNYVGGFATLVLDVWDNFVFTAAGLPAGAALSASSIAPWHTGSSPLAAPSWSGGVATVTAKHQISRPTNLAGVTQVTVSARPKDLDDVTTASAMVVATATPLRFGRLRLLNFYGSELLPARVEARAEYWAGNRWVRNTEDACTTLSIGNFALGNRNPAGLGSSASAIETRGNGGWDIVLARPAGTPPGTGSLDLVLDLGNGTAAGDACLGAAWTNGPTGHTGSASLSHLLGQWCGSNYDKNPAARIKFGSPKAPYIYLRERY